MKKDNFSDMPLIVLICYMIFVILIASIALYVFISTIIDRTGGINEITIETKCYDKFGSEIIGIECEKTIFCTNSHNKLFTLNKKCSEVRE